MSETNLPSSDQATEDDLRRGAVVVPPALRGRVLRAVGQQLYAPVRRVDWPWVEYGLVASALIAIVGLGFAFASAHPGRPPVSPGTCDVDRLAIELRRLDPGASASDSVRMAVMFYSADRVTPVPLLAHGVVSRAATTEESR